MNPGILEGYVFEADFAKANGICRRTVAAYRSKPDGLPFVRFGGKVWIPVDKARKWLETREQDPNPRRGSA
jgi:hypothetical protein